DGPSLGAQVLRTGRPARIDDYSGLESTSAQAMLESSVTSAVGVPIMVSGKVWGVVCVATTGSTPLDEDTEARLADFTELLGTAIANAENREALMRLADEQAALRRVATLVAEGATPDRVFEAVRREVAGISATPLSILMRYDSDGVATLLARSGNFLGPIGSRWVLDGDTSSVATVYRTGRPARI